jgi:hypothetical protein
VFKTYLNYDTFTDTEGDKIANIYRDINNYLNNININNQIHIRFAIFDYKYKYNNNTVNIINDITNQIFSEIITYFNKIIGYFSKLPNYFDYILYINKLYIKVIIILYSYYNYSSNINKFYENNIHQYHYHDISNFYDKFYLFFITEFQYNNKIKLTFNNSSTPEDILFKLILH